MNNQLNTDDEKKRLVKRRRKKFAISVVVYGIIIAHIHHYAFTHSQETVLRLAIFDMYYSVLVTLVALWLFWRPYNKADSSSLGEKPSVVPKHGTRIFTITTVMIMASLMAILPVHTRVMAAKQIPNTPVYVVSILPASNSDALPQQYPETKLLSLSLTGYDQYKFDWSQSGDPGQDFLAYCLAGAA